MFPLIMSHVQILNLSFTLHNARFRLHFREDLFFFITFMITTEWKMLPQCIEDILLPLLTFILLPFIMRSYELIKYESNGDNTSYPRNVDIPW